MPRRPQKHKLQRSVAMATHKGVKGKVGGSVFRLQWAVRGGAREKVQSYEAEPSEKQSVGAEQQPGAPQKAPPSPLNTCAAVLGSSDCTSQFHAFPCPLLPAFPSGPGFAFCGLLKAWPVAPSFLPSGVAAAGQACSLPWWHGSLRPSMSKRLGLPGALVNTGLLRWIKVFVLKTHSFKLGGGGTNL